MAKIPHPSGRSFGWYGLKNDERFDLQQLKDFRFHVARSIEQSQQSLEERLSRIDPSQFESRYDEDSYHSYVDDLRYELDEVERLSQELSIVALNKKAEISTNKIIDWHLPNVPKTNRHNFEKLDGMLPFDLTSLAEYDSRNELRMLNNSVKHSGLVGSELSKAIPAWGGEHDSLPNLGPAYERLAPKVRTFMHAFAKACQIHSIYD